MRIEIKPGNVVKQYTVPGGARVKICDDSCRGISWDDAQKMYNDAMNDIAYPALRRLYEEQEQRNREPPS